MQVKFTVAIAGTHPALGGDFSFYPGETWALPDAIAERWIKAEVCQAVSTPVVSDPVTPEETRQPQHAQRPQVNRSKRR